LILADGPPVAERDSITSGYSVPWARNLTCLRGRAAALKMSMNVCDDRPLLLGVGDALQLVQELVEASTTTRLTCHALLEEVADLLGLALPEEPVVDEHAGEAAGDRLVDQGRDDAAVDAPGEGAEDMVLPAVRRISAMALST